MKVKIVLSSLLVAGLAFAAVTNNAGTAPTPKVYEVTEGSTLQLVLSQFTREDGKTAVVPGSIAYRLDCPQDGLRATPTPLLPSQHPTPASSVTTSIPGSAVRYQPNGADCVLSVSWTWLPGQCSTTTTTSCNSGVDCPSGQTCEPSVGNAEAVLRIKRRRFPAG